MPGRWTPGRILIVTTRRFWLGVSLALTGMAAVTAAGAATRIALIIGNSHYARASLQLANPANDAAAMQRALQQAGFETIVKLNARRLDFYRMVDEFSVKLGRDPDAVGLFYYAGHGVQSDGTNYLIPVDADIESDADLEANAFDVNRVLRGMKAAQNQMNIVILDACRDNPLPRRTRGFERGLARMEAPSGTFIAYAAAPDQSAQDGALGANGVFTGELVKAMAEPGVPLEQMFKKVIAGVNADTHGRQRPWSEASLQGDFYFHAALPGTGPTRSSPDPKQLELAFWESIKDSGNAADFAAYLRKYPRGEFAGLAANRMKRSPPAAHATKPAAVSMAAKTPSDGRCESILQRAQLGETINDEDRAYLKARCQ
jgi:hypothetical protein